MTNHFTNTTKVKGKDSRRDGSSYGYRKLAEMVWTWAESSTFEQRQSEKLDHRRLTAVYGRQANANRRRDLIPSRDPRAGRVHRQSMRYSVPYVPLQHLKARTTSLYGIRSRDFSQFRLNLADEGAEWCGRTWTMKTPAEQWSLSLIGVAWVGTTGWRLNRHLHYPGMTVQKTLPTTGERIVTPIDGFFWAGAARQSRRTISWQIASMIEDTYRVAQKSKPQIFVHIFVKYWPIFKIFSLLHSVRNL